MHLISAPCNVNTSQYMDQHQRQLIVPILYEHPWLRVRMLWAGAQVRVHV